MPKKKDPNTTNVKEPKERVIDVEIEDQMRGAYLDYAMSVIVGRALPDVRDGLKPVHREERPALCEISQDCR